MLIVALFTIAKIWKQQMLSTDEWIKEMYVVWVLLSHEKEGNLPLVKTCRDPEGITVSEAR